MDFIPQPYASFMGLLGAMTAVVLLGLKLINKLTSNGMKKSTNDLCQEHDRSIQILETSMKFVKDDLFPALQLQIDNRFDKTDKAVSNIHKIISNLK